jgi:ABC-type glycerol-3-phosphate transport system substrate-binding protein
MAGLRLLLRCDNLEERMSFLFSLILASQIAHAFLLSVGSSGSATGAHERFLAKLVAEFRHDHPLAQVEARGTVSYVAPVVETMMYEGTSDVPDIAVVGIPETTILLEKGRLASLASVLAEPELREIRARLRRDLDVQYYGGKQPGRDYLLPFNRSNNALYVNTTLLDNLGPKPVVTWDELVARLKTQREQHPGLRSKLRISMPQHDWTLEALLLDQRGSPTIEGQDVKLDDAAARAVFGKLRALKRDGVLDPVLTQSRAFQDFVSGSVAAAFNSMSSYGETVETAKFPFRILLPPRLKSGATPIGGGDLMFPKTTPDGIRPAARNDMQAFVHWYYLERGAELWAELIGYHPVTTSAFESEAFRRHLGRRPQDRDYYLSAPHVARQSFMKLERSCNVVEIRKAMQDAIKEILDAGEVDPVMAKAKANVTALVRKPCP